MKITTQSLDKEALNYAVASIENPEIQITSPIPNYCGDWALCGPLLDKAGISLRYLSLAEPPMWSARKQPTIRELKPQSMYAQSPLVAVLRVYVEETYGYEVDIPEEILLRQITIE